MINITAMKRRIDYNKRLVDYNSFLLYCNYIPYYVFIKVRVSNNSVSYIIIDKDGTIDCIKYDVNTTFSDIVTDEETSWAVECAVKNVNVDIDVM